MAKETRKRNLRELPVKAKRNKRPRSILMMNYKSKLFSGPKLKIQSNVEREGES